VVNDSTPGRFQRDLHGKSRILEILKGVKRKKNIIGDTWLRQGVKGRKVFSRGPGKRKGWKADINLKAKQKRGGVFEKEIKNVKKEEMGGGGLLWSSAKEDALYSMELRDKNKRHGSGGGRQEKKVVWKKRKSMAYHRRAREGDRDLLTNRIRK